MVAIAVSSPIAVMPRRPREDVVALAGELFQQFHARCFWHSPHDLEITADLVPFVAKGLRTHGGHQGFRLASCLRVDGVNPSHSRRVAQCR